MSWTSEKVGVKAACPLAYILLGGTLPTSSSRAVEYPGAIPIRRLGPIELLGHAGNWSPIFPIRNEGSTVAVELAELADLRDQEGALLVHPTVLAISGERFDGFRSIGFNVHKLCPPAS
jgi:hypothetical protein